MTSAIKRLAVAGAVVVSAAGCGQPDRAEGSSEYGDSGARSVASHAVKEAPIRLRVADGVVHVPLAAGSRTADLALTEVWYGCEDAPGARLTGTPRDESSTTTIERRGVKETFEQRHGAVEHTLELGAPPAGCGDDPVVSFSIGGGFRARAFGDEHDHIELIGDDGRIGLGYGGLSVFDRDHRVVPAWFSTSRDGFAIHMNARSLAYPLTIDPLMWGAITILDREPVRAGWKYGWSAAISGDVIAVGAIDDGDFRSSGAVYINRASGLGYTLEETLFALEDVDNPTGEFGRSLALQGDELLAGHTSYLQPGLVAVYTRGATGWSRTQKIDPPAGASYFGYDVSASGSRALVGSQLPFSAGAVAGAIAYQKINGSWVLDKELTFPWIDQPFPSRVAISGNVAVVSLQYVAYVFQRSATAWSAGFALPFPPNQASNDGARVATNGTVVAVGLGGDESMKGSVALFTQSGSTWVLSQTLTASNGRLGDGFGNGLAMDGNRLVVTAPGVGLATPPLRAYVFELTAGVWKEITILTPVTGTQAGGFGYSAALSGGVVAVGAPVDDSVHVYKYALSRGSACTTGLQCLSGYCVDGVCCSSACGGCGACSVAAGATTNGVCRPKAKGANCRVSTAPCDATEVCDGTSALCPADQPAPAGTSCRGAAGACDVAEVCSGVDDTCPADGVAVAGTVCRPGRGGCDVAEQCDGASKGCPTDAIVSSGVVCRKSAGQCDAEEVCDGLAAACPLDTYLPAETPCRATQGLCDVPEVCPGTSAACPLDELLPSGTPCRPSTAPCDAAERCSGFQAACPPDAVSARGTLCRDARGPCDAAETCDGAGSDCPADAREFATHVCRPSVGACDLDDACTGDSDDCPPDQMRAVGTRCREPAGDCDRVEVCDGTLPECPVDTFMSSGTPCRSSSGECDPSELCSGDSVLCPADVLESEGAPCSSGACRSGACVSRPSPSSAVPTSPAPGAGGAGVSPLPTFPPANSPTDAPSESSSCSCRTVGGSTRDASWMLAIGLVAALSRRRRSQRVGTSTKDIRSRKTSPRRTRSSPPTVLDEGGGPIREEASALGFWESPSFSQSARTPAPSSLKRSPVRRRTHHLRNGITS